MKLHAIFVAAIAAVFAVAALSINYIMAFGTNRSTDAAIWGQFGDYFGGVLNPLFAIVAFLSALWSISVPQGEARATAEQLATQTAIAQKEMETLSTERLGKEYVQVIRDIDNRLSNLLQTIVSPPGAFQLVTITQMVAEAERLATIGGTSAAFDQFLVFANMPGTVVEAHVREIKYLVIASAAKSESSNRCCISDLWVFEITPDLFGPFL